MIKTCKKPPVYFPTVSGAIASFNSQYAGLPLKSCVSQISGYQEGSGIPSPQNKRPLHAWSGASLGVNTINIWDEQLELGTYSGEGRPSQSTNAIRSKAYEPIPVLPNTQYYFSCGANATSEVFFYKENRTFISYITITNGNGSFTTPQNCKYIKFDMYRAYGTTYNNDISINYPATDTSYHAFNGAVFTFGQDIYSGYIDWERGVVVGTHGYADLGSLNWQRNAQYINPIFLANIPEAKVAASSGVVPDAICSQYKVDAPNRTNVEGVNYVFTVAYYYNSSYNINIIDKDYSDVASFKTAMNGVYLAYELATPITIPLGGINLLTQQGVNNIFCDTGNTTLEYLKAGR